MDTIPDQPAAPQRCVLCGGDADRQQPHVPCYACRTTARGRLFHEERHRSDMLDAYYAVLNDIPEFRADLSRLAAGLHPSLRAERPTAQDIVLRFALDRHPAVQSFARRWRLPRTRGLHDLDVTLSSGDDPPRLVVGLKSWTWLATGLPGEIKPFSPAPFLYDPTESGRGGATGWVVEYADWLARQVRESIVSQAKAIEDLAKAAGWRRSSSRYLNPGEVHRLARRLCRRAVLGWTYDEIADEEWQETATEENPDADPPTAPAVQLSVQDWARKLDIPLGDDA